MSDFSLHVRTSQPKQTDYLVESLQCICQTTADDRSRLGWHIAGGVNVYSGVDSVQTSWQFAAELSCQADNLQPHCQADKMQAAEILEESLSLAAA